MPGTNISKQLVHDYPNEKIIIDADNQAVYVNESKNTLLLSTSSIERMNIFSTAGKHFYQVIVNLIYSRFGILPEEGTLADTLVIKKEDFEDFQVKKLSALYKVGFLEDGENVKAVDFDDGIILPKLLEDDTDDPLSDENIDENLKYYRYSFWREEDPEMEELEVIDEEDPDKTLL